jgi:hypothetical protein
MGHVKILEKRCCKTVKLLIDFSPILESAGVNPIPKFNFDHIQFTSEPTFLKKQPKVSLLKTDNLTGAFIILNLTFEYREIND